MREIFISKQKNKNGRRYDFARFKGVKDAHKLARELDQMVIGGLKMYVNIPKYGRDMARMVAAQPKPQRYEEKHQNTAAYWRQPHATPASTSYVAVVARNKRGVGQSKETHIQHHNRVPSLSSIHLDISLNDKKWFSEAWVGRLKNRAWFDRVEDDPLWDFGADITPKYMGDDMVLLLGLTDAKAKRMMQEAREGEESMFYSLEKWNPSLRMGQRLTWVQCWGIPLLAWDKTHIQKIVAAIGDLVDVDDDVDAARRVDRARVLIRTPWSPAIQRTITVYVGGEVYKVQVVEKYSQSIETCHCRRRSVLWSSEEVKSDDSSIRTSVSGMRRAPYNDDEAQAITVPPNTAGRRRTFSDFSIRRDDLGTAAIPNGLTIHLSPLGNCFNPRVTVTCIDKDEDQVARQGLVANEMSPVKERCKMYGAQAVGRVGSNEEANFFHKNGNKIDGKEDDVAEVQDFSGEETRDLHLDEGVGNSESGFPIHTPTKPKGLISSSPQLKKNALSNNWKVYSQTRRCQKQLNSGSSNEELCDTTSQLKITTIQWTQSSKGMHTSTA